MHYPDRHISKLIAALMLLRKDYSGLTINQALAFLLFGNDPDARPGDVAQKMGISKATLSRIIDKLYDGKTGKLEGEGLNYVSTDRWASTDARRVDVVLTPKGHEVWEGLQKILGAP